MKAGCVLRFGGPEVLEVAEWPEPEAGPGEVRVAAATVNPADLALRAGAHPLRPQGGAARRGGHPAHERPHRAHGVRSAPPAGRRPRSRSPAGAVGGYAVQLARGCGLRVLADAQPSDEALVRGLGTESAVARRGRGGRDPGRRPGSAWTACSLRPCRAPRSCPRCATAARSPRSARFGGEPGRGTRIHPVMVTDHLHHGAALGERGRLAGSGRLSLRVADPVPPDRVAGVHRRLAAGAAASSWRSEGIPPRACDMEKRASSGAGGAGRRPRACVPGRGGASAMPAGPGGPTRRPEQIPSPP